MLPVETLQRILFCLSRDDLDVVELVNHHMRSVILTQDFVKWGPLRKLSSVHDCGNDDTVTVTVTVGLGCAVHSYQTSVAFLRDAFAQDVGVFVRSERTMRWLIAILPRMRIIRLNLIRMPSITSDISMQLFKVIKCRQLDLTLDDVGSTVPSPAILDLMMSDRFDFLHDSPPDVVEQEWDCTKLNGFEKSLSLHVARLEDGGMNALVGALRKKAVESKQRHPSFKIFIREVSLDADEIPGMRHLNRTTGQHFVVENDNARDGVKVSFITVMQPQG